jgi:hypothetical protein
LLFSGPQKRRRSAILHYPFPNIPTVTRKSGC